MDGRDRRPVVKVVVADDQTAVREGLVTLLETMPGVEVAGAAADGEEAIAIVAGTSPDVVLMDLRMPGVDGVEATRRIHADHPATRVVVLTTYADDESILGALRAGAIGYLTKDAGRDQIRRAIEAAAAGQAILDPEVQARLVQTAALPSRRCWPSTRWAYRTRSGSAPAHRHRPVQLPDRPAALPERSHGQDPHQPHLHQDQQPRPLTSRRLRPPPRTRNLRSAPDTRSSTVSNRVGTHRTGIGCETSSRVKGGYSSVAHAPKV